MSEFPKPVGLQRIEDILIDGMDENQWVTDWAAQGLEEFGEHLSKYNEFETYYKKLLGERVAKVVEIVPVPETAPESLAA